MWRQIRLEQDCARIGKIGNEANRPVICFSVLSQNLSG